VAGDGAGLVVWDGLCDTEVRGSYPMFSKTRLAACVCASFLYRSCSDVGLVCELD